MKIKNPVFCRIFYLKITGSVSEDPEISTDKQRRAVVEFYSSDEPGSYKVLVEGFTTQGDRGSAEAGFSVSHK